MSSECKALRRVVYVALIVVFEANIFFNYFMAVFSTAGSCKEWPKPWNAIGAGDANDESTEGAARSGFGPGAAAGAEGLEGKALQYTHFSSNLSRMSQNPLTLAEVSPLHKSKMLELS